MQLYWRHHSIVFPEIYANISSIEKVSKNNIHKANGHVL